MLGSKEDAEDVLQEVFAAAFNAILADEREINVRPWLYRIARNRSLNHLRRASAIGVDSMDIHFAEHGISTGEKVLRRESFRQLIGDVQKLPETQRTALLLREIDALSYEQIAQAMETTVPSVKSLLVRARISLAEAAEARQLSCEEVRVQARRGRRGAPEDRGPRTAPPARLRTLPRLSQAPQGQQPRARGDPSRGAAAAAQEASTDQVRLDASAGGAHAVGAGGATAGASAAAGAGAGAAGGMGMGGLATAGAGALATKAAATLAAAALVTAGAVEVDHSGSHSHRHHAAPLTASVAGAGAAAGIAAHHVYAAPAIVRSIAQPASSGAGAAGAAAARAALAAHRRRAAKHALAVTVPRHAADSARQAADRRSAAAARQASRRGKAARHTGDQRVHAAAHAHHRHHHWHHHDSHGTPSRKPCAAGGRNSAAGRNAHLEAPPSPPPAPTAGSETGPRVTPVTPPPPSESSGGTSAPSTVSTPTSTPAP